MSIRAKQRITIKTQSASRWLATLIQVAHNLRRRVSEAVAESGGFGVLFHIHYSSTPPLQYPKGLRRSEVVETLDRLDALRSKAWPGVGYFWSERLLRFSISKSSWSDFRLTYSSFCRSSNSASRSRVKARLSSASFCLSWTSSCCCSRT